MPRSLSYACRWLFGLVLFVGVSTPALSAVLPSEVLLPDTTQGFFSITNVDTLSEQWEKTQLGHLMADPAMQPFQRDVRRQIEQRWDSVHDRLGLTLEDLRDVPGGEAAIAMIAPAPGKAALAIVVDVTGKRSQAAEMLKKVTERQLQRGAKRSVVQLETVPDPIVQFDLPEAEEQKEAQKSTLDQPKGMAAAADAAPRTTRLAFYCVTGDLLVVTDNLQVMKGILDRAGKNSTTGSLAEHKPFQEVMRRCKADYGGSKPQMRWFLFPLGYAEAARAATPEEQRRKGKSILEVMRNQGVGAIRGVGGFADFSAEGYDLIHRTAIFAPPPYENAMKMLVLPNHSEFGPQTWVPRDIATYTTLYFDILNAFDNFGPLFDELFGQGEKGVWDETKEGLKLDPNGPQIDLREELIRHMGQRVSMVTDYELPITTTSERLLFAIEVKDANAVAKALEKLLKNDKTVRRREIKGQVIWEMIGDQAPEPAVPEITFGDVPAVTPAHPPKKSSDEEDEQERKPLLPHAASTVWNGHLVVASHIDFLLKIIAPAAQPEPLSNDPAYQLVSAELKKLNPKEKCFCFFSHTDEEYRATYELIRQNKMPQSETMFAKLLNSLFGDPKKDSSSRRQQIDGSQLPPYESIRKYLGPAGTQVTSEPNGWYLQGVIIGQPPEQKPAQKSAAAAIEPSTKQAAEATQAPSAKKSEPKSDKSAPATKEADAPAKADAAKRSEEKPAEETQPSDDTK